MSEYSEVKNALDIVNNEEEDVLETVEE
jgi:hypothetical protein